MRFLPFALAGATLAGFAIIGCGGDDSPARPDAAPLVDSPAAGTDAAVADAPSSADAMTTPLGPGAWTVTNVSSTPGTIATQTAMTRTASGTVFVAWSESDQEQVSDQDILVASGGSDGWKTEVITEDVAVQNTFPAMVADGDTVHLVWSGYPEGRNDVYYAAHTSAGGWSEPVNLTNSFEGSQSRDGFAPALAIGPDGQLAIAYESAFRADGESRDPTEIRVIRIADGAVTDGPVTVIPTTGVGCDEPDLLFDAAGALHVAASCGPFLQGDIYYTTDAGGTFSDPVILPANADHADTSPTLDLAADGATVYVGWAARPPCIKGTSTCGEIFFTSESGGTFSEPVAASGGNDSGEFVPTIAFDPSRNQILAAFHRFLPSGDSDYADIFLTASAGGDAFTELLDLTPDTATSDEWFPTSLYAGADGSIQLVYEGLENGSDPVNSDVYFAEFVPATGTE